MGKKLYAVRHDRGNCRLYVQDDDKNQYVILDQGRSYEKWGLDRFELYTHSRDGEPDSPVKVNWELVDGLSGTDFSPGLYGCLCTPGHL